MSEAGPPAVVIGGWSVSMVAIRSLGRAGVPVYVLGVASSDPAEHSRYCTFVDFGSTMDGLNGRWLEWFVKRGPRGAVVLPGTDPGLEFVARERQTLRELGYHPIEADDEVLTAMIDKARTAELARELGVDAPWTVPLASPGAVEASLTKVAFPCALKPRRSHLFARAFGLGNKLLVAEDPDQLADCIRRADAAGLEMMITELVPGPDELLLSHCGYLDEHGEPLTQFTFRKIRQFPPRFGLGCYVVSDWNEEVIEASLRFLRGVGLRGLFHVEFKRDPRDGRLKLLECNHRFTIEALFAPRDLALVAYARALGRPLPPVRPYREGIHQWSPIQDFRSFLYYRRHGEYTWGRWLRSLAHRQRLHVFSWDDPMPSIGYNVRWVGGAPARRRRRRREASQSP